MSFNKFLNNKKQVIMSDSQKSESHKAAKIKKKNKKNGVSNNDESNNDESNNEIISETINKNQEDYFFNKSDLDKIQHFKHLIERYKLCRKVYYYFDTTYNLWVEQKTDDSIISHLCAEAVNILLPEKREVIEILDKIHKDLSVKKQKGKITVDEMKDLDEILLAIKEFNKFINKTMKEHQTVNFARKIINFFNHRIIDDEFCDKININFQHLLPLKNNNINLKTMKIEQRIKEHYFTKSLNFDEEDIIMLLNNSNLENDISFKIVDNFFLDLATGYKPKKDYLQKIMGYFLSGAVPIGRSFYIWYGQGKNGKSALVEILSEIMGHYCKAIDTSIIIKKGVKNTGQASPEIEVLDYGLRLGILSETDEGDKLNESLLKNISGYDVISYRPLYGKQKDFKSETKLCMLTNNKPFFKLSDSMIDRLRFTHFKSRFITEDEITKQGGLKEGEYKVDRNLVQNLKTAFKKEVLCWMIIGAKKVFEDEHMNIPDDEVLKLENMSYINEMDTYKRFVDECLTIDEGSKELTSQVQDAYKKFCIDESIPPLKPSKLKELLMKQFKITKISNNYYNGFKLKINEEEETKTSTNNHGLDDNL